MQFSTKMVQQQQGQQQQQQQQRKQQQLTKIPLKCVYLSLTLEQRKIINLFIFSQMSFVGQIEISPNKKWIGTETDEISTETIFFRTPRQKTKRNKKTGEFI